MRPDLARRRSSTSSGIGASSITASSPPAPARSPQKYRFPVMHHFFDLGQMTSLERYKLLCGVVVPRPIALVTSIDGQGRVNAAPFSFFNVFSEDPPQVVLGLQHKPAGEPKDTARNLAEVREFVV